ncbi:anthranilate synthase component II [Anaeroselena agilis]|uniref:Aminodeoxychorismate/anthranilate synthase component II n=1 Tax=Anaeroselena agilis TaxID=3063788 RepID=A0ABU3P1G6_9FIRM|nr:aminodeoxychorismate/anthranilate synthase component II [Selenomonadales bacterium 4137-cl]
MILLIDNYDSFTYNIYQYVTHLGRQVRVARNDRITLEEIAAGGYRAVIISPGPGTPDDAGISKDLVARFAGRLPILGVCLGHQVIGEVFGGKVVRAPKPVHGKTSAVSHDGRGLYRGLPQPFTAGRYHSLIIDRAGLPDCLTVTATSDDGLIMGVRHNRYPVEGIQFHPESVLTPDGVSLLANFVATLAV